MAKPAQGTAHIDGPMCFIGCPRQPGRGCSAQVKGPDAPWTNHGSDEKPTLTPSYNCVGGCGWHGYVVDGKLIDAPPGLSSITVCTECHAPHLIRVVVRAHRGIAGVPERHDVQLDYQAMRSRAEPIQRGNEADVR